jgi:uncharacterized protein (DUF952 family)
VIFHIATRTDWDHRTPTHYSPSGLADEGFVHCSSGDQVIQTAQNLFAGRNDLLILDIDETRLTVPVQWEDLYDMGQHFPHIYGALPLHAIVGVRPFPHDDRGRFDWWRAQDAPVARPAGRQSHATQALLRHFAEEGYDGTPRPLGIERGLEFVSHLEGSTIPLPYPPWFDLQALSSLGMLLRRAHDASEGFSTEHPWMIGVRPTLDGQIIGHRDIGPGTVLWQEGRATALIDWEMAEPADRLFDLGVAAVSFAGLVAPQRAQRAGLDPLALDDRLQALALGYGDVSPAGLRRAAGAALEEKLMRIRTWGAEGRSPWSVFLTEGIDERIEETLDWVRSV